MERLHYTDKNAAAFVLAERDSEEQRAFMENRVFLEPGFQMRYHSYPLFSEDCMEGQI